MFLTTISSPLSLLAPCFPCYFSCISMAPCLSLFMLHHPIPASCHPYMFYFHPSLPTYVTPYPLAPVSPCSSLFHQSIPVIPPTLCHSQLIIPFPLFLLDLICLTYPPIPVIYYTFCLPVSL